MQAEMCEMGGVGGGRGCLELGIAFLMGQLHSGIDRGLGDRPGHLPEVKGDTRFPEWGGSSRARWIPLHTDRLAPIGCL